MTRISLIVSSLFAAAASAQILPSSGQPACLQQCPQFLQAQAACAGTPATQDSCFCQSSYLTTVKSQPSNNLCPQVCTSQSDWQSIANWYNGKCANNGGASVGTVVTITTGSPSPTSSGNGLAGTGGADKTGAEPSATGTFTNNAAGATAVPASAQQSNPADYKNGQEWWAGHYQWIIMLIVLLVVFTILGVGGSIWYRRRQRRKNIGGSSGPAGSWGPNNSAHDFDTQGRRALAAAGPVTATEEKTEGSSSSKAKTLTRKLTGR